MTHQTTNRERATLAPYDVLSVILAHLGIMRIELASSRLTNCEEYLAALLDEAVNEATERLDEQWKVRCRVLMADNAKLKKSLDEAEARGREEAAQEIEGWEKWYDKKFVFLSQPPDSWTADVMRTMIPKLVEAIRAIAPKEKGKV
jgi:hypothetical protein